MNFDKKFNLSAEKIDMYKQYEKLLKKWQKNINLVGNSTVENIWERHIYDSLQLAKYILGSGKLIYDLGAGAGFPAMVLAINDIENTYYLVECDIKKATFLDTLKMELKLSNVVILNEKIENIINKGHKADIITSRALASLDNLLIYAKDLLKEDGYCLFLKGKDYQKEIDAVLTEGVSYEIHNSLINPEGKIIKVGIA